MKQHLLISLRTTLTLGVVLPLLLGLLSACSMPRLKLSADVLTYYIPEVVQGNFISREQKEFLKLGMSRQQVRDVLGTPLVASVFHEQRWDYVFTIRRQNVQAQSFSVRSTTPMTRCRHLSPPNSARAEGGRSTSFRSPPAARCPPP